MVTKPIAKLSLLVILLPLACGERAIPSLDGSTPTPDTAVIDTRPSSDGAGPIIDVATTPDVATTTDGVPAPDLAPPPTCCKPLVCINQGTKSEGWYDPCLKKLIKYEYCSGCVVGCKDCGPYCGGNGFYTYCPFLKQLRTCNCEACRPKCKHIGSWSEGWYDGCTGKLINYAICSKCKVSCVDPSQPRTGIPQPRFYSSCDMTKPLTKTLCIP